MLKNIAWGFVVILAVLSGYLFAQLNEKKGKIEKKDREIATLNEAAENKAKTEAQAQAARARMTPAQFGNYIAEGDTPLRPLQVLTMQKQDLPLDPVRYLDKPQL